MEHERWTVISPQECDSLLRANHLGRIGLAEGDLPLILPVNYVLDGNEVVFRTGPGTLLAAAAAQAPIALEIDGIESRTQTGWSVLVRGYAQEITDPVQIARLEQLELVPWAPGVRAHFVRVTSAETTGRRITVPPRPSEYWG